MLLVFIYVCNVRMCCVCMYICFVFFLLFFCFYSCNAHQKIKLNFVLQPLIREEVIKLSLNIAKLLLNRNNNKDVIHIGNIILKCTSHYFIFCVSLRNMNIKMRRKACILLYRLQVFYIRYIFHRTIQGGHYFVVYCVCWCRFLSKYV